MNAEQRAAMRKLAEEATPGPWYSGSDWVTADLTFESVLLQLNSTGSAADGFDLGYIAAANPSTVLQLLDYIETLESALQNAKDTFECLCGENSTERLMCNDAVRVIDAAMQGETE